MSKSIKNPIFLPNLIIPLRFSLQSARLFCSRDNGMPDMKRRFFLTRQSKKKGHDLPWLKTPQFFHKHCDQCTKCLTACPEKIIIKGDGGFPCIDFSLGECTFCYQCADACPLPLFLPQSETAWQHKIQINAQCLSKNGVECRSCQDCCEPNAVQFKPVLGGVSQPLINPEKCHGCGACVSPCPVRAISMELIHE